MNEFKTTTKSIITIKSKYFIQKILQSKCETATLKSLSACTIKHTKNIKLIVHHKILNITHRERKSETEKEQENEWETESRDRKRNRLRL